MKLLNEHVNSTKNVKRLSSQTFLISLKNDVNTIKSTFKFDTNSHMTQELKEIGVMFNICYADLKSSSKF